VYVIVVLKVGSGNVVVGAVGVGVGSRVGGVDDGGLSVVVV
jgi:hypothetical protein